MKAATQRAILRWVHLIAVIPVLGYVYGKPADVEQYVGGPREIFVPLLILTGYWMYAGVIFGMIGAAAWLGAYHLSGFGAALLSQIVLLIGRKIWQLVATRKSN
jgi:thiosulfate reductase cytochrome b subunit